jgi:hypothetical protein
VTEWWSSEAKSRDRRSEVSEENPTSNAQRPMKGQEDREENTEPRKSGLAAHAVNSQLRESLALLRSSTSNPESIRDRPMAGAQRVCTFRLASPQSFMSGLFHSGMNHWQRQWLSDRLHQLENSASGACAMPSQPQMRSPKRPKSASKVHSKSRRRAG